jgi:hypothetical protein
MFGKVREWLVGGRVIDTPVVAYTLRSSRVHPSRALAVAAHIQSATRATMVVILDQHGTPDVVREECSHEHL